MTATRAVMTLIKLHLSFDYKMSINCQYSGLPCCGAICDLKWRQGPDNPELIGGENFSHDSTQDTARRRLWRCACGDSHIGRGPNQVDMPSPWADRNFHTVNVRAFAAEVEKATGGKLAITVHSNASLLKLPEIKRGVQTGQVQIGETLISTLGNEDAMFAFDSVPGLATSHDAARKLYNAARPQLESRFAKQGLMMLYSVAWPPQGIYAKKELASLADLKGAKFRAYNPATARFADLMGASPITVQAAEVAQAFRTGMAESMISSGATGVDTQSWDYLTHNYDLSAFLPQNVVVVHKAAFDALPTDVQRNGATMAAEWAARAGADAAVLEAYRK